MKIKLLTIPLLIFYFYPVTPAQKFDIKDYSFFLPHSFKNKKSFHLAGLAAAKLPEEIIETEEVFRTPLFFYKIKYGLFENASAEAGLETNIITYHFSAGFHYNIEFDNWGLSAGGSIAYWFGRLKTTNFDAKAIGINFYPGITIGRSFKKFSVSLKSELIYFLTSTTYNGDLEASDNYDTYSGYSLGLYVEQPLWKDNVIVIGFRSVWVKFYYPVWAAFPTFDSRLYISEATVGLIL